MKLAILCLVFLMFLVDTTARSWGAALADSLMRKYPNQILTPHFGILSEVDLAKEARAFPNAKYGPDVTGAFWQCFPTRDVLLRYDTRRTNDPMGSSKIIVTMCDIDIRVRGKTTWSDYWGRRGYRLELCQDIEGAWKKLTRNEKYVCFNGMPSGVEKRIVNGKERWIRGWVWNRFRTKKGCYSYFDEECSPPSQAQLWMDNTPEFFK